MDKNGKLFGKLSIFDVVVVLLIIILAAGTFYKFHSTSTNTTGGQKDIVYTVLIANVRDFTTPYYREGLVCTDGNTGEVIGTVQAVRVAPYTDWFPNQFGEINMLETPGTVQIELDIKTPGLETDQGYYANGTYELKTGSKILMDTKYVEAETVIQNIEVQ